MKLPIVVLALATMATTAAAQSGTSAAGGPGGYGSYSPTKTGDGGGYSGYAAHQTGLAAAATAAQGGAPAGAAAAPSSGGSQNASFNASGIRLLTHVEPPPTWRDQVATARTALAGADADTLRRTLRSRDQAEVFAALSFESDGAHRFPEADLVKLLGHTRARMVARGVVLLLSRRGTAEALQALLAHVEDRGPADDTALELLLQAGFRGGKAVFLERASAARASNKADLLAIRALAFQPGDDVIVVLRRLQQDWAEDVQRAANEALDLRAKAGLKTALPYRKPPVGKRPEEVAFRPGENPRHDEVVAGRAGGVVEASDSEDPDDD